MTPCRAALLVLLATSATALAAEEEGAEAARPRPRLLPLVAPAPLVAPVVVEPAPLQARPAGRGKVTAVAAGLAYLDRGRADGLAVGQRLSLARQGRATGSCAVEAMADRSATCRGDGLRAGDTFAVPPRPVDGSTAIAPAARALPPLLTAAEVERRRAAVDAYEVPKVQYVAPPRQESVAELQRVEASFLHQSFLLLTGPSPLRDERLELRVRGVELGAGWRLFADGAAVYRNDAADRRFRTGDSAYLEVRELEVARREPDAAFTVALGRVLPWYAPGSSVLDGAQLGWRGGDGEVGLFGGAVPDVLTTDPTLDRATAGVYGRLEHRTDSALVGGEGRVAWVRSPELGTRVETEALGRAAILRALDVSGQARLGFGDTTAPGSLDQARLDVVARVAEPVSLTASVRYVGLAVPGPEAPALFPGPGRHADLTASWSVTSGLTLRAIGGFARDLGSTLERGYLGPELALPRLFGAHGGVAAGWTEERGWTAGRTVWAQANGEDVWGMRLLVRGSLLVDARAPPYADTSTVGLLASLSKDLLSWLRFRCSGMGQLDVTRGQGGPGQGGLSITAGLDGLY